MPKHPGTHILEKYRFPCPSCGSDLRYAPQKMLMHCDFCGTEVPVPESRETIRELDLRAAAEADPPLSEMESVRVAQCTNCGAQVEFDADLQAQECPFCASPMIIDTGAQRHIKPQAQLPFLLDAEDARQQMGKWLGRLWFAPSDLRKYARAHRAMQGMYVPYWTYDAETRTSYTGQRGRIYYENRSVSVIVNGRRQRVNQRVARVRWSPASGRVQRVFDDVLVLGATSLPKRFTDALAPWDLRGLSPYDPHYLAGFRAEGYTVPVREAYGEAKTIMNRVIESDVRRDIGGDQQRINQLSTKTGALTFKHVLLPVWVAAYKFRGRTFRFVVNGRSGSVQGERPYSKIKIALAIIAGLLVAALFAMLQINQGSY
jgi:predicted RNA-binding Zn-ribbon protein involved in translation (DUF1610 family)